MVERVTLAVDGGAASDAGVAWVIDRAKTVALSVEITSVVGLDAELPDSDDPAYGSPFAFAIEQARARLEAEAPEVTITTKLRHGLAHEALERASRHCDLLVLGGNTTSPVAGIMHGTIPLKVAGHSQCAAVVVPATWSPSSGPVVAGWADDPTADAALDFAADEAERRKAPLVVVTTWTLPQLSAIDGAGAAAVTEQIVDTTRELLGAAVQRVHAAHPTLEVTQHLQPGSAAAAIVHAAAHSSLVVVGSRGRGALASLVLGSVSHDVLLAMPAPVAVIPRKHESVDVYPELVDEDL